MSRQVSPFVGKVHGLQRVTWLWGVSRATIHRHRQEPVAGKRPGPIGAMPDEDLVRAIRQLLTDSPFHGEGYRKLWARLRFAGIRTSRRRVLKLTRVSTGCWLTSVPAALAARDPTTARSPPTEQEVDLVWGTDPTSVMTGEGQDAVFIALDHHRQSR